MLSDQRWYRRMPPLHERHDRVLRYVAETLLRGPAPTNREIMAACQCSSTCEVHATLEALRAHGFIAPVPPGPVVTRGIALTPLGWEAVDLTPPTPADAPIAAAVRAAFTAGEPLPPRVVAALGAEAVPA